MVGCEKERGYADLNCPPVAFQRAKSALRQHTARRVRTVLGIYAHKT